MDRRAFLAAAATFVLAGCSKNGPKDRRIDPRFVRVGRLDDVVADVRSEESVYVPEARAYLAAFPHGALEAARDVYDPAIIEGIEATGLVAMWQACTHLSCRVPYCSTSGRYECACHGAIFTSTGDRVGGPAPRGMDRFKVEVVDDVLYIDTRAVIAGTAIGVDPVGKNATGPACVG